jgi:hypothetical protein
MDPEGLKSGSEQDGFWNKEEEEEEEQHFKGGAPPAAKAAAATDVAAAGPLEGSIAVQQMRLAAGLWSSPETLAPPPPPISPPFASSSSGGRVIHVLRVLPKVGRGLTVTPPSRRLLLLQEDACRENIMSH